MAKKKVTVNIEEGVWLEFKKKAFGSQLEAGQNPSVSQYLENMIIVKLTLPIEARHEHKGLVTEIPVQEVPKEEKKQRPSSLTGHSGEYSKAHQCGKGAK